MSVKHLLLLWVLFTACGMVKRGAIPWEERAKKVEAEKIEESVRPEATISVATMESTALSKDEKKVRSK